MKIYASSIPDQHLLLTLLIPTSWQTHYLGGCCTKTPIWVTYKFVNYQNVGMVAFVNLFKIPDSRPCVCHFVLDPL